MTDTQNLFVPGPIGRLAVRTKNLGDKQRKPIVMVQGSNLSGQSIFDFTFPGGEDYSLMNALVDLGYAPVTFAIRGYGISDPPEDGFSVTTEAAMEDLDAVINWLATQRSERPHLLGFSWGGRIVGRYAEANGAKIDKLVLYDAARGGGNLVLPAPGPDEAWWTNKPAHYEEKLEPEFTDAAFLKALGEHVVKHESRSPNGIRLENAKPVIPVEPTRITNPTLMIYGVEAAKAAYMQGGLSRGEFFERLAAKDKAFVILPDGGDFAHFQKARFRLKKAIGDFLSA